MYVVWHVEPSAYMHTMYSNLAIAEELVILFE